MYPNRCILSRRTRMTSKFTEPGGYCQTIIEGLGVQFGMFDGAESFSSDISGLWSAYQEAMVCSYFLSNSLQQSLILTFNNHALHRF